MLKNYLVIAWRNIKRSKIYSIINIVGLAIGLTISLIIAFYVIDDITFDHFHDDADTIYRILSLEDSPGKETLKYSIIAGPIIPAIKEGIPEIIAATRLNAFGLNLRRQQEAAEEDTEDEGVRAYTLLIDPDFFNVFSFKILAGDVAELDKPNTVFITPRIAEALFGDEDPLGQSIQTGFIQDAVVAGIVEEPPLNSHIRYDMITKLQVQLNPVWWTRGRTSCSAAT